jgi:membrane carboxypeptidase/penicillin-binding protein
LTTKLQLEVELTQVPEVQASIVSLNAKNGEVVAMVGGYDYHTSKFNNATQGLRQPARLTNRSFTRRRSNGA